MSKVLGYIQEAVGAAAEPMPGLAVARDDPNSKGDRYIAKTLIQAEVQAIRWRDDGVDPTAAIGMLIPVGATLEYDGDHDDFRMIAAVAGAVANVTHYGL